MSANAQDVILPLSHIYFIGVIIILGIGFLFMFRVTYLYMVHWKKLNSVLKSYVSGKVPPYRSHGALVSPFHILL